ncbi:MAG: hypothetical protein KDD60_05400 [Bdellovibrionales bacterium]|nr:hypothetical protein [Bdellovibrionales bacterium]
MKIKLLSTTLLIVASFAVTGCTSIGNALNPFQDPPSPEAFKGSPNDHALRSESNKIEVAREQLEQIGKYPRAHQPQPQNPVIQPAVVRMMWVPDHLNSQKDLVPAHFYYLKVLDDQWAVTDVFERQDLVSQGKGAASALPYTSGN